MFLWKGQKVRFIELKRSKRDKIRDTQIVWLKAALKEGLSTGQFFIVEWEIV